MDDQLRNMFFFGMIHFWQGFFSSFCFGRASRIVMNGVISLGKKWPKIPWVCLGLFYLYK